VAHDLAAIRKGLASGSIPDTILKQIDDQEVLDRLAESGRCVQEANGTSGAARARLLQQARAVMQAPPRVVTEREVREIVAKAAAIGNGLQADALRRRATELLERHPPAPRRAVTPVQTASRANAGAAAILKAATATPARIRQQIRKADGDGKPEQVAVFDSKGDLVGVCDADDITFVQGAAAPAANEAKPAQPAPAPAPAAAQDQVAKAARRAPARRPARTGQDQLLKAFREGWQAGPARQGRR
jgi:hypothetical protein